jgi:hypothetical protein
LLAYLKTLALIDISLDGLNDELALIIHLSLPSLAIVNEPYTCAIFPLLFFFKYKLPLDRLPVDNVTFNSVGVPKSNKSFT